MQCGRRVPQSTPNCKFARTVGNLRQGMMFMCCGSPTQLWLFLQLYEGRVTELCSGAKSWQTHCKGPPVPCLGAAFNLGSCPCLTYIIGMSVSSHVLCLFQPCLVDLTFQLDLGLASLLQTCPLITRLS